MNESQLILSCGTGGVGKTTTSILLGIALAQLGKRVHVLTIDPAKRLADALGCDALTHSPTRIQLPCSTGMMEASMMDPSFMFTSMCEQSIDTGSLERLKGTAFYKRSAEQVQGLLELMAVVRINELLCDEKYNVVIVDTPPSYNALQFLDAPDRLISLFGAPLMKWLLGNGNESKTSHLIRKRLSSFLGGEFIHELGDFFSGIRSVSEEMVHHAEMFKSKLTSPFTRINLTTTASNFSPNEMFKFVSSMIDKGLSLDHIVFNRCLLDLQIDDEHRSNLEPSMSRYFQRLDCEESNISGVLQHYVSASQSLSVSMLPETTTSTLSDLIRLSETIEIQKTRLVADKPAK